MSCSETSASRGSMVIATPSGCAFLVASLTVEWTPVAPIGELCGRSLRIWRARQFCENAPKIGLRLVAVARDRPAFGETGQIFAAIVPIEPVEDRLAER